MKKILRWAVIILVMPFLLLLGGLGAASFLGLTINLDAARPLVQKSASKVLQRRVVISGPVTLVPGSVPRLEVQGLRIDNQDGWGSRDFVKADLLRVQLDLFDLFHKRLNVDEITVEGVTLFMESRADGINNWSFTTELQDLETSESQSSAPGVESAGKAEASHSLVFDGIDSISFTDITVHYRDTVLNQSTVIELDELTGEAAAGEAVHVRGRGVSRVRVMALI